MMMIIKHIFKSRRIELEGSSTDKKKVGIMEEGKKYSFIRWFTSSQN